MTALKTLKVFNRNNENIDKIRNRHVYYSSYQSLYNELKQKLNAHNKPDNLV